MGDHVAGPLGALSHLGLTLRSATTVDAVARAVLRDLPVLPGVSRVGLALAEGGGRRLRFLASDADAWSHIDAYDDVPLTRVVRTGEPVYGDLGGFGGRFAELIDRLRAEGTRALAVFPLPGATTPIGGLLLYFDRDQRFDPPQLRLLEAAARRTAQAVRRVRVAAHRADEPAEPDPQPHRAVLALDDDPRAPGTARRFLRGLLAGWSVEQDSCDAAELCLSELVTNAVVHAGTGSTLTVVLEEDRLTVAVRDRGGPGEAAALVEDDDPLKVFGRGLLLVDALSDRWGTDHDDRGTRSWFTLTVDADRSESAG